ncbi:MAG TPA: hypothetical protein VI588_03015 [Candidatus Gracilibacteria bacterium]|nr:hypothetical protein [Candidatus Gracilibacteria bacterium]
MEAPKHQLGTVETGKTTVSTPATAGSKSHLMSALTLTAAMAAAALSVGCDRLKGEITPEPDKSQGQKASDSAAEKAVAAQKASCSEVVRKMTDSLNDKPFVFTIDGEGETTIGAMCANDGEGQTIVRDAACSDYNTPKNGATCKVVDGKQKWSVPFAGSQYSVLEQEARAEGKSFKGVTNLDKYCLDGRCQDTSDNVRFVIADKTGDKVASTTPAPTQPQAKKAVDAVPYSDPRIPRMERDIEHLKAGQADLGDRMGTVEKKVVTLEDFMRDTPSRAESEADDNREVEGRKKQ